MPIYSRILFEDNNSLLHQLRITSPPLQLIRDDVVVCVHADELHEDVQHFIAKLKKMTGTS